MQSSRVSFSDTRGRECCAQGEKMRRLLKDQSHLIAALKEEGKLLMQQLASERKENRYTLIIIDLALTVVE
ncbi:hypothetical protein ANCDUO_05406 [Ancylostoma duodenale]|uniref:Uncharacterized protein n=1 Tax=Ancylostoma duodenale TaxID=51022 RepID=A0A0C2GYQ4_9BILA|nr:hypothetical protein ANCDUO_05406 [Ancylostoma duodenale]